MSWINLRSTIILLKAQGRVLIGAEQGSGMTIDSVFRAVTAVKVG